MHNDFFPVISETFICPSHPLNVSNFPLSFFQSYKSDNFPIRSWIRSRHLKGFLAPVRNRPQSVLILQDEVLHSPLPVIWALQTLQAFNILKWSQVSIDLDRELQFGLGKDTAFPFFFLRHNRQLSKKTSTRNPFYPTSPRLSPCPS